MNGRQKAQDKKEAKQFAAVDALIPRGRRALTRAKAKPLKVKPRKPAKRQCLGIAKTGKRCGMPPLRDSEYCFNHDSRPEIKREQREMRKKAAKKGGQTVARALRQMSLREKFEVAQPSLSVQQLCAKIQNIETPADALDAAKFVLTCQLTGVFTAQEGATHLVSIDRVVNMMVNPATQPPDIQAEVIAESRQLTAGPEIAPENAAWALRVLRALGLEGGKGAAPVVDAEPEPAPA